MCAKILSMRCTRYIITSFVYVRSALSGDNGTCSNNLLLSKYMCIYHPGYVCLGVFENSFVRFWFITRL
jgi:hypothetical protein